MRLPHIPRPEELDVALVGIPFDGGATYRPGPRFGPRNIRVQSAIIRPYNPALKINPFERKRVADFGDLAVNPLSIEDTFERIERGLAPLVKAGVIPLSVGGDHSILLPILRALAKRHGPLALVQLDAHSDTWDSYFGSRHSHGTPVRRAFEEGILVPNAVVQIGSAYWLHVPVGKLHTDRYIPLHPQLKELLDGWLARRPEGLRSNLIFVEQGEHSICARMAIRCARVAA